MTSPAARLCCLDLDTFFVSVERLHDPSLIGKPVVVGALPGSRGVVTACSYEVRAFGVRSGMGIREAVRLAPHAIYLPGRRGEYGAYSEAVRKILDRYTPVVKPASIDEFYLDFGGCERLYARPGDADADATIERVVHELREVIQAETGLPASAGIGATRAVAKIASGRAKPAGVCMVRVGEERAFVSGLPVRRYPGIGPVAEAELVDAGLQTLGQLLELPPGPLRARFGHLAESVRRGIDGERATPLGRHRPAFHEHDPAGLDVGSISNERTFHADVGAVDKVEQQLRALVERVCWRARKRDVRGRTVTLKLRYADFHTITRGRTLTATHDEAAVLGCVLELFRAAYVPGRAVRLVGVALSNLTGPEVQLGLPFGRQERPASGRAIDEVRARFGYDAIRLGAVGVTGGWTG
jgi:DNA polymerase-4